MTRNVRFSLMPCLITAVLFGIQSLGSGARGSSANVVTFSAGVAPILQKHCMSCHRPG